MTSASGVCALASLDAVTARLGERIGSSDWVEVGAARVEQFVAATGCRPPDAVRWLLVSLVPTFQGQIFTIGGLAAGLNYGSDRIRFADDLSDVRRVRATAELRSLRPARQGSLLTVVYRVTDESGRELAVIENISLLVAAASS